MQNIKLLAEDGEPLTVLKIQLHTTPQPHVAKGYTPIAPQRPQFNTSRDLKLKNTTSKLELPAPVFKLDFDGLKQPLTNANSNVHLTEIENDKEINVEIDQQKRHKKSLRSFTYFVIFLVIFAGSLYATYNFLLGQGIISGINRTSASQLGIANSDVNLRPSPNIGNDPMAL